jgi:predicted nucleic acid-binding protein
MKIFLDANILISVLNKEFPLFSFTSRILSLADQRPHTIFTSPLCLAIASYFAEKKSGRSLAKSKIALLVKKIHVTPVDHDTVIASLKDRRVNDFEDGLEYYAAIRSGCEIIVTEDVSDFYFSAIPVVGASNFLTRYF